MNRHRLPALLLISASAVALGAGVAVATGSTEPSSDAAAAVTAVAPVSAAPAQVVPATAVATTLPPATPGDEVVTVDDGVVRTITVVGNGSIKVAPDMATIELGVETVAPTGGAVMDTLSTDSETLLQTLITEGIAEEDVQTSSINLWPEYDDAGTTVTGYRGSLTVSVTVRDIESVGPTLDVLQESVGDNFRINGLYFSHSDPDAQLNQPRVDAIAQAEEKAAIYADAAELEVVGVLSISESGATPPILYQRMDEMAAPAAADSSVSISPGQLEFSVNVTVTFEVR